MCVCVLCHRYNASAAALIRPPLFPLTILLVLPLTFPLPPTCSEVILQSQRCSSSSFTAKSERCIRGELIVLINSPLLFNRSPARTALNNVKQMKLRVELRPPCTAPSLPASCLEGGLRTPAYSPRSSSPIHSFSCQAIQTLRRPAWRTVRDFGKWDFRKRCYNLHQLPLQLRLVSSQPRPPTPMFHCSRVLLIMYSRSDTY